MKEELKLIEGEIVSVYENGKRLSLVENILKQNTEEIQNIKNTKKLKKQ